jgi:hypothetical protein
VAKDGDSGVDVHGKDGEMIKEGDGGKDGDSGEDVIPDDREGDEGQGVYLLNLRTSTMFSGGLFLYKTILATVAKMFIAKIER